MPLLVNVDLAFLLYLSYSDPFHPELSLSLTLNNT